MLTSRQGYNNRVNQSTGLVQSSSKIRPFSYIHKK